LDSGAQEFRATNPICIACGAKSQEEGQIGLALRSLSIFIASLVLGLWASIGCTAAMSIQHQLMDKILRRFTNE